MKTGIVLGIDRGNIGQKEITDKPLMKLNLSDHEAVKATENEKSLAFFAKLPTSGISKDTVRELKAASKKHNNKNARICLHSGPESLFHDMVILEHIHSFFPPHQHPTKTESVHILEGRLAVFIFHESGEIREISVLSPEDTLLVHIAAEVYHAYIPLSDFVVYHETKPGPFLADADNVFAPWAPETSDVESISSYRDTLLSKLD